MASSEFTLLSLLGKRWFAFASVRTSVLCAQEHRTQNIFVPGVMAVRFRRRLKKPEPMCSVLDVEIHDIHIADSRYAPRECVTGIVPGHHLNFFPGACIVGMDSRLKIFLELLPTADEYSEIGGRIGGRRRRYSSRLHRCCWIWRAGLKICNLQHLKLIRKEVIERHAPEDVLHRAVLGRLSLCFRR